jgi:hypothetical protein
MVRDALIKLGRKPGLGLRQLRGRPYRKLTEVALLKVDVKGSRWHWVVWDGQRVFDPERPERKRYSVSSFLLVTDHAEGSTGNASILKSARLTP